MKMQNRQLFFFLFLAINTQSCTTEKTSDENHKTTEKSTISSPGNQPLERDQMLQLLAEGRANEVLQSLVNTGNKEVDMLQKRLDEVNQDFDSKKISFQDWAVQQNSINYGVFRLIPQNTRKKEAFSREELKKLIENDNLEAALDLLIKVGYEDVIVLQARLNLAKQQMKNGAIEQADLDTVYEQINDFILAF